MNLKNTYLGFTDNMKPMTRAKIEKVLDKLLRYDKKDIMTRKEWLLRQLQAGNTLKVEEDVIWTNKRTGEFNKPKTEYRLVTEDKSYYEITKTEYDYSLYLIDNNLTDDEIINKYVTEEQNRVEAEKQRELESEKLKQEAKEFARKEKNDFENWLKDQAVQYNDEEKIELAKQIFLNEIGIVNMYSITSLLVLIENIENDKCRTELMERLGLHNKGSRKTFSYVTGLGLPNTVKGTDELIKNLKKSDYQSMITAVKAKRNTDKVLKK